MAAKGVSVVEYVDNMRALLAEQPELYGLMVERQVQSRLLPRVAGSRAHLEPELWTLLVFCLDGHDAAVPPLDDATYERAVAAALGGNGLGSGGAARFPDAAKAVAQTMVELREVGVYPRPRLS